MSARATRVLDLYDSRPQKVLWDRLSSWDRGDLIAKSETFAKRGLRPNDPLKFMWRALAASWSELF